MKSWNGGRSSKGGEKRRQSNSTGRQEACRCQETKGSRFLQASEPLNFRGLRPQTPADLGAVPPDPQARPAHPHTQPAHPRRSSGQPRPPLVPYYGIQPTRFAARRQMPTGGASRPLPQGGTWPSFIRQGSPAEARPAPRRITPPVAR